MTKMTPYQQYIAASRYARYLPEKGRRETWEETVDRYIRFFKEEHEFTKGNKKVPWGDLREAILNLEVMPSMRCMMTAGPALARDNVAGYNCAYVAVDHQRVFDEIMYVLMCGTGVGFSVERQCINKLPEVAEDFNGTDTVIVVRDSKIGWARGLKELIGLLYNGQIPRWDLSGIREAGAPLRTFGGRASGPDPLNDVFSFCVKVWKGAAGRRLNSLEVHDVVCKIASAVVCGGVRRSALISLSNLTDGRMAAAKTGAWYDHEPQRALANNSVAYTERPDMGAFMSEWKNLYDSKCGERGLFSRYALEVPERRDRGFDFGTNPCSEIILRPKQFCNLSEVVVRPSDDFESLKRKVILATILGTLQATLTDFRYLSKKWRDNTEEERLLGVSLTGVYDNYRVFDAEWLGALKDLAVDTNERFANLLGIPQSAAVTCVKPSGTVSQLVDCASGLHPRYSQYYLRRVRGDKKDPISLALIEQGVHYEEDVLNPGAWVFTFPMKAPEDALTVKDISAAEHIIDWYMFDENWCEHKPSVSIYVREHEWMQVGSIVYDNFDKISGVSFFPYDDHVYKQAPYEPISEEQYKLWLSRTPETLDLAVSEEIDTTTGSQELACHGGACEL